MRPEDQFLIAVPTRNREDTILKSLPSLDPLLGLTDVRIVVSDNSDQPSEKVRNYCEAKGIDWIRPDTISSMTAHWNWILETQKYRAITLMTDRTWLMADVWLEAKGIAEKTGVGVSWNFGTFTSKSILARKVGVFSAPRMTGRHFKVPFAEFDRLLRDNHVRWFLPRLLNSLTHRSEFEKVKLKFSTGLQSVSPDFEYAYKHVYMDNFGSLRFIDKVGIITHSGHESNGGAMHSGFANKAAKDFVKLSGLKRYDHAPFPEELDGINGTAHELNLVLSYLGREPYVGAAMVRRIQRERQRLISRRGPFRHLKTAAALLGLSGHTMIKLTSSDKPECLGKLRVPYSADLSHILDQFAVKQRS